MFRHPPKSTTTATPLPYTTLFRSRKTPSGTPEAAQRLAAASQPVGGTLVTDYLAGRSIGPLQAGDPLRFHPRCYYRPSRKDPPGTRRAWPAMIALVTNLAGAITGVHRTWLDPTTIRSEEHTSELQSLMRIPYAVFCLKKKTTSRTTIQHTD